MYAAWVEGIQIIYIMPICHFVWLPLPMKGLKINVAIMTLGHSTTKLVFCSPSSILFLSRLCRFLNRKCSQLKSLQTIEAIWTLSWIAVVLEKLNQNTLRKHAYSNILKILPPKNENFQIKIFAQKIDCGYSLEPPHPQSMFWTETRKIMHTHVNPSFTI